MNLPEKLSKCPRTLECTAKAVFQDDEGNLFRFDEHGKKFVPHVCTTKSSEKPKIVYTGQWYNHDTNRTRWTGPFRMQRSAEIPPVDARFRKRGSTDNPVWELKGIEVSELKWEPVKDEK